jgi:hypothetical protein
MNMYRGAVSGWNGDIRFNVPRRDEFFGEFNARLARYKAAEAYYYNTVYDTLDGSASILKQNEKLYKFIRGIENPIRQENNLIVSYSYRGSIDVDTLKGGSMPLRFDNKALEEPIKRVLKWSNFDQHIGEIPQGAALRGDCGIWITSDIERQRVRMTVIDPARVKYTQRDEAGNIKAAILEWTEQEETDVALYMPSRFGSMKLNQTKTFVKTLKVTRELFQTFKDGEPFAFYADESGKLVSEWPNVFGFVPLKMGGYSPGKDGWYENSFFGTPRRQIDELNDQASIINDSIRQIVTPIVKAINIINDGDLDIQRDEKTGMTILYLNGKESNLESLVIPLDITAASANRAALLNSLERNMPILALQKIRDIGGNLSGVAIENMFGDAVSQILSARKNLNPIITGALQMAVSMASILGFEDFGAFNADSFDNGDMELSIADYSVIDDTLSKSEKITMLPGVAMLPAGSKRQALTEMGYTEDVIETIIAEDSEEQMQKNAMAVKIASQQAFGDDEEDEDIEDENTDTEEEADAVAVPVAA